MNPHRYTRRGHVRAGILALLFVASSVVFAQGDNVLCNQGSAGTQGSWPVDVGTSSSTTPVQVRVRDATGTTLQKVDANGNALESLGTRIAGENIAGTRAAISDWMEVYKAGTYTSTPTKTTTVVASNGTPCTTAGGASCTIIYASTDWLAWPNFCITLKETAGANPVTNVLVEYSPDGTSWEVSDSTTFAALAANAIKSLCVAGNSHRFARIEARSAAGSTLDVWFTANQN